MTIRLYLCNWWIEENRVVNPISNIADISTGFEYISYHYPEAGSDGLPKKNICLVFVKGTDFSAFNALDTVDKLPKIDLSVAIDDTPNLKAAAINLLKNKYGVPLSIFADCVIWRDVIKVICKYIEPNFKSFGKHLLNGDFN